LHSPQSPLLQPGHTPHRARYVNPATGAVSEIVVVPCSQSLGWMDGYSPMGTDNLARLEARRILIERHLGLPSGSRRTRHASIDHAPLAFDLPSPPRPQSQPQVPQAAPEQLITPPPPSSKPPPRGLPSPKPTPRGVPIPTERASAGGGEAADGAESAAAGVAAEGEVVSEPPPPPPPPPFPVSDALGRRASLPVCRELAGAEATAAFIEELALLASRRPSTRQPPPPRTPEPVAPLLVSARADSPLLYSPPEDDLNLHAASISPAHSPPPPTPARSTGRDRREAAEASSPLPISPPPELVKPGTPGIPQPPPVLPSPPGTAGTTGDGGGASLRPMTGISGMRTPRLTEDGEVTEWGNVHYGDRPPSGRPPKDVTPPGGSKAGKSPVAANGRVPATREGGRIARVARTRASLAALLQVR
jgi:hypothetical protein